MMLLHVFNPKAIKNSCDFDLSPIFFVESPDMEGAMKIVIRENVNINLDDYFISSPFYDKKYEEEFIRSFIAYKLSTCIEDPGYYKNNSNKVFGIVYYHNNDIRNIVYSDMEDHINYFTLKNEMDQVSIEIEKLKSSVEGGIKCEHCGIELLNASITQSKINELAGFITRKKEIESLMTDLSGKEKGFVDLKKHYPEVWQKMSNHKWDFVYKMFLENIKRGMKEGLYRQNMDPDIIARLYVASTDLIMAGEVYPWPEYEYGKVFLETFRFHIRGMASDEGIAYLKERIKRETNE